jgi:hypothetical protein
MATETDPVELRTAPRFDVAAPIELDAATAATAKNISAQGIYFLSPVPHEVGSLVNVTVEYTQGGQRHLIRCEGKVLRNEPQPDGVGVAARFVAPFFADGSGG